MNMNELQQTLEQQFKDVETKDYFEAFVGVFRKLFTLLSVDNVDQFEFDSIEDERFDETFREGYLFSHNDQQVLVMVDIGCHKHPKIWDDTFVCYSIEVIDYKQKIDQLVKIGHWLG